MTNRILLALLVTLGACGDDHPVGAVDRDSGSDTQSSTSLDAAVADPGPSRTDAAPTIGLDTAPVGPLGATESWTGWIENYQFPSGSDAIKLSFTANSTGQITGHVVLGSGTPPPPATDPNVGYPPGFTGDGMVPMFEGFAFTMVEGSSTTNRLRFSIEVNEPWAQWCALQTPPSDGSEFCLPNCGAGRANGVCSQRCPGAETTVVDCGKLFLCQYGKNTCYCRPTGCTYREEPAHFDLAVAGDIASGGSPYGNVHFTKDP